MKDAIEVLLIGGSRDGERIQMSHWMPYLLLPIYDGSSKRRDADGIPVVERYCPLIESFGDPLPITPFFVDNLTAEQAFQMLAEGYRKPTEKGHQHDI